jgi:hypothetical protein
MVQGLNQSNIGYAITDLNLVNTMAFGDSSSTYFPLVHGEYTNFLLQEQIGATPFLTS